MRGATVTHGSNIKSTIGGIPIPEFLIVYRGSVVLGAQLPAGSTCMRCRSGYEAICVNYVATRSGDQVRRACEKAWRKFRLRAGRISPRKPIFVAMFETVDKELGR